MTPRKVGDTTGRLWVEPGDSHVGTVAEVAPLLPISKTYTFWVPKELESVAITGRRVTIPMGRKGRSDIGFIVGVDHRPWDHTLRPIDSVLDSESFLTPDLVKLGQEISEHYACPLGRTLKAMTPEAVRQQRGLAKVRYVSVAANQTRADEGNRRSGPKARVVLETLHASAVPIEWSELLKRSSATDAVIRKLISEGRLKSEIRRENTEETNKDHHSISEPTFGLRKEQREALESIESRIAEARFTVSLLFGVSGSGKTEIYIRAMRKVLASGRQAILLVPEIVLTTQLVGRLASRFEKVAVLHSGLSEVQRSLVWHRIAAGGLPVIVGTRSAVFAPCPNLGLICVDEEQEGSYKNLQAPRFHVRDVAIMRAKHLDIPVVLGSATPSLETWYRSDRHPDYLRLTLHERVKSLPMPKVHLVDMRDEFLAHRGNIIMSRLMDRLLSQTLERGEQALILINRRGFATRVFCPSCKSRLECSHCSAGLVAHTTNGQSICHYCRTRIPTPKICSNPSCGAPLMHVGAGSQQVEEVLARRFPNARIQRVDSDTMHHRSQYQRIVDDFEARKIDLLVGTQMIAKGLDFPFVSFVGVIHADATGLAIDFRAQERLFQLITQVAGRAGRAETPGTVVVQTTSPDLPALTCAIRHDYASFAAYELPLREKVGLPPYRRVARIVLSHRREETAKREAERLAVRIRGAMADLALPGADVVGPAHCALSRLRGQYRYDLLVRTDGPAAIRKLFRHLDAASELKAKVDNVVIDVDPVSFT